MPPFSPSTGVAGGGAGAGNIGTVNVEFTGRTTGLEAAAARAEATVKKTAGVIGATQAGAAAGAGASAAAGAAGGSSSESSSTVGRLGTFGAIIGTLRGFRLGLLRALGALGVFSIAVGAAVGLFKLLTQTIPDAIFGLEKLKEQAEFASKAASETVEQTKEKLDKLNLSLNYANDELIKARKQLDDAFYAVAKGAASSDVVQQAADWLKIAKENAEKIQAQIKLIEGSKTTGTQARQDRLARAAEREMIDTLRQIHDEQVASTRRLLDGIATSPNRVLFPYPIFGPR